MFSHNTHSDRATVVHHLGFLRYLVTSGQLEA